MNSLPPPGAQQGQEQVPNNTGTFPQNYIQQQQAPGGMSGPPLLGGMPMQNTQQMPHHHGHMNQQPNLTNTQPFVSAAHAGGPQVVMQAAGQITTVSGMAPSGIAPPSGMMMMQNTQQGGGANNMGNIGMQQAAAGAPPNMSAPIAVQKATTGAISSSGASTMGAAPAGPNSASSSMPQMQQQSHHHQQPGAPHPQMSMQQQPMAMQQHQQVPHPPPLQQQPHVQQAQLLPTGAQQQQLPGSSAHQVRYAMQPGAPVGPGGSAAAPGGGPPGAVLNPHQQTNMLSGSKPMLKPWHNAEEHRSTRDTMIRNIIALLQQRRPNATQDWHEKLPHMARRLESELYLQAESLVEYSDPSTLKTRLQQLALTMGGKQAATKPGGGGGVTGVPGAPSGTGGVVPGGVAIPGASGTDPSQQQLQQQPHGPQGQHIQQQMQQQQQQQAGRGTPLMQQQQGGQYSNIQQQQPQQQGTQQHMMQQQGGGGNNVLQQGMQQQNPQQAYQHMQQQGGNSNMAVATNQMRPVQQQGAPAPQYSNQMQGAAMPGAPNLAPGMGGYYGGIEGQQQHGQQQHMQQQPHAMNMGMNNIGMVPQQGQNVPMQQQPPGVQQQQPQQAGQQQQAQQPPQRPQFVSISALNPLIANNVPVGDHAASRSSPSLGPQDPSKTQMHQQPQAQGQQQQQSRGSAVTNRLQNGAMLPPAMGQQGQLQQQGQMAMQGQQMQGQLPPGGQIPPNMYGQMQPGGQLSQQGLIPGQDANGQIPGQPVNHTDEHRRQVLKQQQQRLLLLRHASKCPHDNGRCPVTPHCASMKQLWKHIMSCKDQECKVPHCVSSRYVLSHYSKCKDQACPVCGPVREAIRRNYERSREVVNTIRQNDPNMSQAVGAGGANMTRGGVMDPSKQQIEAVGSKRKNAGGDVGKDGKKPRLTKKQQKELEAQQRVVGFQANLSGPIGHFPISSVPTQMGASSAATAAAMAAAAGGSKPRKNANTKKAEAERAKAGGAGGANSLPQYNPNFSGLSGAGGPTFSGVGVGVGASGKNSKGNPTLMLQVPPVGTNNNQELKLSLKTKPNSTGKLLNVSSSGLPGSALNSVASSSSLSAAGRLGGDRGPTIPLIDAPLVPVQPARPRKVYPLDPVSCALYNFTPEHIHGHFKTIQEGMKMTAAKIREICMPILDSVLGMPHAYSIFGFPVDTVALNLPDYHDVIKLPMDLGTVRRRLETNAYRDLQNFVFDVHLTFDNAMLYNPKSSEVHLLSKSLKKEFDSLYKNAINAQENAIENARTNENACLICGEVSLKFEPPVYYCNGRCGGQRIRRNAFYYTALNNSYHWCSTCFSDLRADQPIRLPEATLFKPDLAKNKKKHSEESEEPWVQCDGGCNRWVHQICGLFNGRRNFSDEVAYVCPTCLAARRKNNPPNEPIITNANFKMAASDLPQCAMSQFLEKRILERLEKAYHETASKLNVGLDSVEKCPPLSLRLVSSYDKMHLTRENMLERYKNKNYPAEFPCRTKCVVLFQNIDGQDVILFGMYVYEYGDKCPAPNQRRVYISYLDSVHYFRPKQYRTIVYHEIIIAYLEYVKARGFHTAHIWACPPLKGDDYILYCHPSDQKTPKDDKLRKWYADLLVECKTRGIVTEITDLYTEYLADPSNDATVLPYFEGDYWVSEAEVIIKDLKAGHVPDNVEDDAAEEDDGAAAGGGGTNKSKSKLKSKNKAKRSTRASRGSVSAADSRRDPVMTKLASIIEPMKEAFFVARLYPKEYADRCTQILKDEAENPASVANPEAESLRIKELQEDGLRSETPGLSVGGGSSTAAGGFSPRSFESSTSLNAPPDVISASVFDSDNDTLGGLGMAGGDAAGLLLAESAASVELLTAALEPELPLSSVTGESSTPLVPVPAGTGNDSRINETAPLSSSSAEAAAVSSSGTTEMEVTNSTQQQPFSALPAAAGEELVPIKEEPAVQVAAAAAPVEDSHMDVEVKDESKEACKPEDEPETVAPSAPVLTRTPSSSSSSSTSIPPLTLGLRSSRRSIEVPPSEPTSTVKAGAGADHRDHDHDGGLASPKHQPAPTPRSRRSTRGKGFKADEPNSAAAAGTVVAPLFQSDDAAVGAAPEGGDNAASEAGGGGGDKAADDDSSSKVSAESKNKTAAASSSSAQEITGVVAAISEPACSDSKVVGSSEAKATVSETTSSLASAPSSASVNMDVVLDSIGEAKSGSQLVIETAEAKEPAGEGKFESVETSSDKVISSGESAAVAAESKEVGADDSSSTAMDVVVDAIGVVTVDSVGAGEKAGEKVESGEKVEGSATGAGAEAKDGDAAASASDGLIPGTLKVEVIAGVVIKDDTEDVDDTQESEHFDTRQSFLNLCQGNHYQFDQLRRAKHTSMMVLYHMHNPDAPKFVPNCTICHADILTGYRYHCEPCDIDVCHGCITNNGAHAHIHPLRAMAIAGAPVKTLTPEQRRERQRAIELHLQLLMHAAACVSGKDCKSKNCQKMKEFLRHEQTCKIGAKKGCPICKRISNLLTLHARGCRNDGCKVPKCTETREHIRQLTVRQQQMDDRRRAMMNDMYSRSGSNANGVGVASAKSGNNGSDDEG